ncbi:DeoR/GlpR family DNA-binding transcription regulator [Volucribacter amazonae]|uniref:DeoR family transcriptional regulator n=1 Tax=Volucribacter amazonae TaxID=256731 RepID=A0A9X4PA54_9PAST|nr:DeoR/GlpR family DNA-binding transcription regulator [Volucribacter amazonae]MDG6894437.1 DeoR family transcriptional regulator [Volucribacter amazonae]
MNNRHKIILALLNDLKKLSVHQLAERLNVSLETIRRDLALLSQAGLIYRTHGGAVNKETKDIGAPFQIRQRTRAEQKKYIASLVADYFFEDMVLGLDASSTSWYVAQLIPDMPCTVVTNSMHNINALASKTKIRTIATGGIYSAKYHAFYGPLSERLLSRLHINISIFSCVGLDDTGAIWESNELNVSIKNKFIETSEQNFLVIDASKFNKRNLIKLADLSEFDILFSEKNLPESIIKYCDKHNVMIVQ